MGNGTQALMQGFGVQSGYRNVENQIIMLKSYDLIKRVVDSLPDLKVDYISDGHFKNRNLYKTSPISIRYDYIAPEAYNVNFNISINDNGTFTITSDDKRFKNLKINGVFGKPVQDNLFFITVYSNTNDLSKRDMSTQVVGRT